jgi:tetratricopeptide (TPR) repeat protein
MTPRIARCCLLLVALHALLARPAFAQAQASEKSAVVQGTICDSETVPLPGASVSLQGVDHSRNFVVYADAKGRYRFENLPSGTYMLHARDSGFVPSEQGPILVVEKESKTIDLHLTKATSYVSDTSPAVQFSDEPQFQIAGITDPSNYGGHGSDTGLRTKEALAKDTDSLKREAARPPEADSTSSGSAADLHRLKGDTAEKEGRPLEAVHEYQLAAQINPSEGNLFAWGAELLLHRAFQPAIGVFSPGHRQFPASVRMAVGLSIATYDRGDTERGEQLLLQACDINPEDPTPYLFMGRLQEAERIVLPGWIDKLKRFAGLAPSNPMAHYYYAVALSKQTPARMDNAAAESELEKAIDLDPKLGRAYLQRGILLAEKKETSGAIAAFKKAIENLAFPDEAHYRLAQIYRQSGQTEKARNELALYRETSQKRTREEEEQRHQIQEFVYTLRQQKSEAPANLKPQ